MQTKPGTTTHGAEQPNKVTRDNGVRRRRGVPSLQQRLCLPNTHRAVDAVGIAIAGIESARYPSALHANENDWSRFAAENCVAFAISTQGRPC